MPSSREWVSRRRSTTIPVSAISALTGQLLKKWVQGREPSTSNTTGTTLPPTTWSIPEADRQAYTAVYARPGRMRAGWAYFVSFRQAAKDFAELAQLKLAMPVLVIGGEKSLGEVLEQQMKLVALDVTVVILKDTGHWVLEERPKETTDALLKFL